MQPLDHKNNNFDFLRVAAASAVIIAHQFALSGRSEPVTPVGGWGGIGVMVFFAISGYLIAGSWNHDPNLLRFCLRRLLRIWPGLAVVCVLVALVLGPLVSELEPRVYFSSPLTRDYFSLLNLWSVKGQLPGVFAGSPIPESVNGSLWTIPIEVRCYAALAIVGVVGLMRHTLLLPLTFAAFAFWFFFLLKIGYDQPIRMHLQMAVVFFCGASLYQLRSVWLPYRVWASGIAAATIALLWFAQLPEIAFTLGLPVMVVLFGTGSTPVLRRTGRFGDISYGLYIYAYPVQQTVIWLSNNQLPFIAGLVLSALVTILLAWLSWRLVEQPALRLKSYLRS